MTNADRLISRDETSARSNPRNRGPYQRYPERESFSQIEIYERPDGTRYQRTRTVDRWGGEFSFGAWTASDIARAQEDSAANDGGVQ